MPSDNQDFIQAISKSLGIDKQDVLKKMDGMTIPSMTELLDAVRDNNDVEIKNLLDADREAVHPLLSGDEPADDSDDEVNEAVEEESSNYSPSLGDEVSFDGKQVVVKVPRGPSGTVGILVDGKTKMVRKDLLKPCMESIDLGADVFGITRMQTLAGLSQTALETPIQVSRVQTVDPAQMKPVSNSDIGMTAEDETMDQIQRSFQAIYSLVPNIKQRDVKTVRKALSDLGSMLNESKSKKALGKNLLNNLEEGRMSRPLSDSTIVDRVCSMGYIKEEATQMVATYLDVLGAKKDNNPYSTMVDNAVVREAIASLNKNR